MENLHVLVYEASLVKFLVTKGVHWKFFFLVCELHLSSFIWYSWYCKKFPISRCPSTHLPIYTTRVASHPCGMAAKMGTKPSGFWNFQQEKVIFLVSS